jgi:hypothetical protein
VTWVCVPWPVRLSAIANQLPILGSERVRKSQHQPGLPRKKDHPLTCSGPGLISAGGMSQDAVLIT